MVAAAQAPQMPMQPVAQMPEQLAQVSQQMPMVMQQPQQPYGTPAPAPAPMPQGPTPTGVPARNGLTAAQVRGATSPNGMQNLAPAPATGWPNAQSWPNAAGMGQAG
jgi:hypothetical protein